MAKNYIEISGEGEYEQKIATFIAQLEITVRAAKDEKAFREARELREQVIASIVLSGLAPENIEDGGIEKWRPWDRKSKPGSYVHIRLVLKAPEIEILAKAIAATTEEFVNERYTFQSQMRRPEFKDTEAAKLAAVRVAVADARRKAQAIADEVGVSLGGLQRSTELKARHSRSGAYGDDNWWDGGGLMMAAGAAGEEDPIEIEKPQRVIKLGYLCRFAII